MQHPLPESISIPDHWHATKPELVSYQEVLDEVSAMLRSPAQAKGLHFDVIVPLTQIKIRTDLQALSQILLNLADDAIRFTDNGGICIDLRRRMDANFTRVSTEFSVEATSGDTHPEQQRKLGSSTMRYPSQSQILAR